MDTSLNFDQILNTVVPSEYVGLPLLDIAFKRTDRLDLEKNNSKSSPYPYILLAFQRDNYCIVLSGDDDWIDLTKTGSDAKLYISTFCKIYYEPSYANMDVIGTLLREYLECMDIHACTYPSQEYWDKIDYFVRGIPGSQMIGRIHFENQDGYNYVVYNLFDKSARFISLTDAQYMKLVYLQMKAFGMKSTMIENNGMIGSMSKDGIYSQLDNDICFISDNSEERFYNMIAVNQNGKWGFIDSTCKIIVLAQYDYAQNGAPLFEINRENIACAKVVIDSKFGLVDSNGDLFVECMYDSIGYDKSGLVFINGMALVEKNSKYGFINKKGELVLECIYDLVHDYALESETYFNDAGIVILKLNGHIVFVNKSGNIVKTASHIERSDNNWLLYDGGYEMVNDAATTVLKFKERLDYLYPFDGDVARARIGNKWGLMNKCGEWITPLMFDKISPFWRNLTRVKVNDKWGVINSRGQWIISPDYDSLRIHNDYIETSLESNSLYFNLAGEQIIEPIIKDEKHDFSDGLIKAELNSKYGFKDASGIWIIKPQYEEADDFRSGLSWVRWNGIGTIIDKSGKSHSRDGLAKAYSVKEESYGAWGFIDEAGRWVIEPKFEDVGYYFEGLAKAKMNGKWGFIDKCGKWVIEPKFEDAGNFHNRVVSVLWNDECHWINAKGDIVR